MMFWNPKVGFITYQQSWICFVAVVKKYKLFQFDVSRTKEQQTKKEPLRSNKIYAVVIGCKHDC
jgi:hypothetical protein